jgi:hypothetical protein
MIDNLLSEPILAGNTRYFNYLKAKISDVNERSQ